MFNQRIRRAFHRSFDAPRAQQPAHERRLASTEITRERHDHAAGERGCEARAERLCRSGVGEMKCQ